MDMLSTHCSNEGHLLHIWQRKIAFITSRRKQDEVTLFYSLSRKRLQLSLKRAQLRKLNKERRGLSDNQKVVLSAGPALS